MSMFRFLRKLIPERIVTKKIDVYKNYEPIGEIQSEIMCKHILNKLIVELELHKEDYARNAPFVNFNDRNVGVIVGNAQSTYTIHNKIRQMMDEFYNASKTKTLVKRGFVPENQEE